jgi:hypothetical protein
MPSSAEKESTTFCHDSQYFASEDFELDDEQPAASEAIATTATSAMDARLSGDFVMMIPPKGSKECCTDQTQSVGTVSPEI